MSTRCNCDQGPLIKNDNPMGPPLMFANPCEHVREANRKVDIQYEEARKRKEEMKEKYREEVYHDQPIGTDKWGRRHLVRVFEDRFGEVNVSHRTARRKQFENEWEVSPWSGNTSAFLIPKMFSALHAALTNPKALDRIRLKLSASLSQSDARSLKETYPWVVAGRPFDVQIKEAIANKLEGNH